MQTIVVAGLDLDAPWTVFGWQIPPRERRHAVLIVGGHLAAVIGGVRVALDAVAPADTADELALLTRTISADLAVARAHRWAAAGWRPRARTDSPSR